MTSPEQGAGAAPPVDDHRLEAATGLREPGISGPTRQAAATKLGSGRGMDGDHDECRQVPSGPRLFQRLAATAIGLGTGRGTDVLVLRPGASRRGFLRSSCGCCTRTAPGPPARKTTAEWGVAHGRGRSVAWQRHGSDVWAAVSDPRPDVPSILPPFADGTGRSEQGAWALPVAATRLRTQDVKAVRPP